jgi:site-specific recombinase XerC
MQLEKPDETPVRGGHGGKGVTTRNESPSTRTRWCFFGWREGERDERNRVVDVHALRVTFGTHLCAAGVPLRTAQAAMRHSKPELTANIYTDPKLLDVAGAIDALPTLALPADPAQTHTTASGTGRWRVMS